MIVQDPGLRPVIVFPLIFTIPPGDGLKEHDSDGYNEADCPTFSVTDVGLTVNVGV